MNVLSSSTQNTDGPNAIEAKAFSEATAMLAKLYTPHSFVQTFRVGVPNSVLVGARQIGNPAQPYPRPGRPDAPLTPAELQKSRQRAVRNFKALAKKVGQKIGEPITQPVITGLVRAFLDQADLITQRSLDEEKRVEKNRGLKDSEIEQLQTKSGTETTAGGKIYDVQILIRGLNEIANEVALPLNLER